MPKNRKYTPNLQKELEELRNSRNKIEEYESNFFRNFYENCKFVHFQIKTRVPKEIFWTGYRQYFVFLVGSLETFLRDTFVFLVSNDKNITNRIISDLNIKPVEISKLTTDQETAEFLSKCFNFQNFDDII